MATYFIIEHPTRGTVMSWEWDYERGQEKPKCSWKGLRTDKGVHRYLDAAKAVKDSAKFPGSYVLRVTTKPLVIRDLEGRKR